MSQLLSDYLTPDQLAGELGRSRKTIDRWHAVGEGPPRTKIGQAVLYRREAVRKWLEARES